MKLPLVLSGGLVAVALAACGGDDPGDPAASATPSAPSSSATVSEEPSPTFDPQEETAKEFIRRWIRLDHRAQITGDVDSYLAITSNNCRSCEQFADRVTKIYGSGGSIETDGGRAASITRDGNDQWTVSIESAPTRYTETSGGRVKTFPGGTEEFVVYVVKDAQGRWVLSDYSEKGQ